MLIEQHGKEQIFGLGDPVLCFCTGFPGCFSAKVLMQGSDIEGPDQAVLDIGHVVKFISRLVVQSNFNLHVLNYPAKIGHCNIVRHIQHGCKLLLPSIPFMFQSTARARDEVVQLKHFVRHTCSGKISGRLGGRWVENRKNIKPTSPCKLHPSTSVLSSPLCTHRSESVKRTPGQLDTASLKGSNMKQHISRRKGSNISPKPITSQSLTRKMKHRSSSCG